jgi:hypothetical protein
MYSLFFTAQSTVRIWKNRWNAGSQLLSLLDPPCEPGKIDWFHIRSCLTCL